jgi:hypothetical protein
MSSVLVFVVGAWVGCLMGVGFAVLFLGGEDREDDLTPAERAFEREQQSWDAAADPTRWDVWGEAR